MSNNEAPPVRYSWRLLRAGEFRLDGGSMFGLIPRNIWSRSVTPDEKGRITVQHNCLLLEGGGKRVLIETGSGDKLDPKSKELFAMEDRDIAKALHEVDCSCDSIDAVVTTHLHFDHSGGLTRLCRPGETPDWTGTASGMAGARPDHAVKLTFSNAAIYAQAREWSDAMANRSVMTRTYFRDHLEPIQPRVTFVDSPRPFPSGYTPEREELPLTPVSLRETPLPGLPGVSVFLTPGHTWGQQAIKFEDTKGRTVVFVPDVMPTVAHVGQAYSLAYDVEPYTSCVSRRWLLHEASNADWLMVLDHEPGNPVVRARANSKHWFDLIPDAP
jgi:glyoxylase-like metal-dependent hydrolase (beta-lactamase superfamily II)